MKIRTISLTILLTLLGLGSLSNSALAGEAYYRSDYVFCGKLNDMVILSEFSFERRAVAAGSTWKDRVLFAVDGSWEERFIGKGKSNQFAELIGPAKKLVWQDTGDQITLSLEKDVDTVQINTRGRVYSGSYVPGSGGRVDIAIYKAVLKEGKTDIDTVEGWLVSRRVVEYAVRKGKHLYGRAFDRLILNLDGSLLVTEGEFVESGPQTAILLTGGQVNQVQDFKLERKLINYSQSTHRAFPSQWKISGASISLDGDFETLGNLFMPGDRFGSKIDLSGRSTVAGDLKFKGRTRPFYGYVEHIED
jgi:hypothetical protein